VAYALPYQKIMDAAMFGLPITVRRPVNTVTDMPGRQDRLRHDMAKAKALDGGERRLGHRYHRLLRSRRRRYLRADRRAGAGKSRPDRHQDRDQQGSRRNWRSEMAKKSMPLMVNFFSGWLDYPEYFFFWCYSGQTDLQHAELCQSDMDALIDGRARRRRRRRQGKYSRNVEGFYFQGL